jgi:cell division protein FtsB
MPEVSSLRFLPLALIVLTIIVVPVHILDRQGLPRYTQLRHQLAQVRAKNQLIARELVELRKETERLRNDPKAVERIARDELGMVRAGEVVFQFPQ